MAVSGSGTSYPRWVDPAIIYGTDLNTLGSNGIPRFATTGARDAAITSPVAGQAAYVTGTGYTYYNGTAWGLLFGSGMIAWGVRTTDSSISTTTEISIMRIDSIPMRSGRPYKATISSRISGTVDNDTIELKLRYSTSGSATTSSTILPGSGVLAMNNAYAGTTGTGITVYTAPADQTVSLLLTGARASGTGNLKTVGQATTYQTLVLVEDIGPVVTSTVTML